MVASRSLDYLIDLVLGLCKHREETEWIEFKSNRAVPDEIGEYISALANSAALVGKSNAYMVWGVDNKSHELIGTDFDPISEKKGNEELENWLLGHLKPKINFKFYSFPIQSKSIVLLEISAPFGYPLSFNGQEFIRVGSYKKKLKDFPEKERALWRVFETTPCRWI